jgi:hypothetical protein
MIGKIDGWLLTEGGPQEVALGQVHRGAGRGQRLAYDEALEWFNYNTSGAYVGEATPIFVNVRGTACASSARSRQMIFSPNRKAA